MNVFNIDNMLYELELDDRDDVGSLHEYKYTTGWVYDNIDKIKVYRNGKRVNLSIQFKVVDEGVCKYDKNENPFSQPQATILKKYIGITQDEYEKLIKEINDD